MEVVRLSLSPPRDRLLDCLELHRSLLGPLAPRALQRRLRGRPRLLLAALVDGQVVGYKFGYEDRPGRFYSWIGGVAPSHRRQGIARRLLTVQHRWARRRGYRRVRTHTSNEHRPMLLLNIAAGFDVIGTLLAPAGGRIILEKAL